MAESWGIKVSLPGVNVFDATPEQCAIHSKYDTHKISDHASPSHYGVVQLTVNTEPANGSTQTVLSFNHGYSYRPLAWAHISDPALPVNPFRVAGIYALDAFQETNISTYVTDTQFRITLSKGTTLPPALAGRIFTIRYYIFAEDGS